jgi:hypothetical protein
MIYPMHNFAEDRSYSVVVIKEEQRFWKKILIVDDDADLTMTFRAVIEDGNNDVDINKKIEVCTSMTVSSLSAIYNNDHYIS